MTTSRAAIALALMASLVGCTALYNSLGGPFKGAPSDALRAGVLGTHARQLVVKAFRGFENRTMHDHHVHFSGNGTEVRFCPEVNQLPHALKPRLNFNEVVYHQVWWQRPFVKGVFLDTANVSDENQADEQYMTRLVDLVTAYGSPDFARDPSASPYRTVFHLLAMDGKYDLNGNLDSTTYSYVSNQYIVELVECLNRKVASSNGFATNRFQAVGSINPLRSDKDGNRMTMREAKDWLPEMDLLHRYGVKWIKWRPATMNLNPDVVSNEFYNELKARDIGLLTHTGDSTGISVGDKLNQFAAPNKMERAINLRLKVVLLHIGRAGDGYSEQFFNLLGKYRKEKQGYHVFGELSAVPYGDSADQLQRVVSEGGSWILNGSDYPAVSPHSFVYVSLRKLKTKGFLSGEDATSLDEIYHYNPLLFDFVLKRSLRLHGKKLRDSVFLGAD